MPKKYIVALTVIILISIGIVTLIKTLNVRPSHAPASTDFLKLPSGFHAELFADNLGDTRVSTPGPSAGPRLMEFKNDSVFVSVPKEGKIFVLEDKNADGILDDSGRKIFIDGLTNPHGLAFSGDFTYIAEEERVIRVKDTNNDNVAEKETIETLMTLPAGGHYTRTIKIFGDKLYVSTGSSCNVCLETESARAALQQCDLNGKNCRIFAKGLRNTVGFVEFEGKIYGTDNGRDWLGDNLPPDELNILEDGGNYGWPNCYGKNIHDTDFDKNTYTRNPCMEPFERESFIDLGAHVAPLGLAFYAGTRFPDEYHGRIFIALHGSWNSTSPVGYKIVTVDPQTRSVTDFATGFIENGVVSGRPVDIMNFRGGLLVTDDNQGRIYKIYYEK